MPISLDLASIAARFQAPLRSEARLFQDVFEQLGDWLDRRLRATVDLERASRDFPVVEFYNGAVTAFVDRSQWHSLAGHPAPGFAAQIAEGGRGFLAGVARIPESVEAGLALPRLLHAVVVLLETIQRSLDQSASGRALRAGFDRLTRAYAAWASLPSTDLVPALARYLPRMAASLAVILESLALFIRGLGTGAGPQQVDTLTAGLGALMTAFADVTPGTARQERSAPTDPVALLSDVVRYVGIALAAIPWLSLYLPPVVRVAASVVRLLLLDQLRGLEAIAWDFRVKVMDLFFVKFENYRRMAVGWLNAIGTVVLSQLEFWSQVIELFLAGSIDALRTWADHMTDVLKKVVEWIRWLQIALRALLDFDVLSLILPFGLGAPLTLGNLIEAIVEGNAALLGGIRDILAAAEVVAPASVAPKLAALRRLLELPPVLDVLSPEPTPPSLPGFPNLYETFFGPGLNGFQRAMSDTLRLVQRAVGDTVDTTSRVLDQVGATSVRLRDQFARSDWSALKGGAMAGSIEAADRLFASTQSWLDGREEQQTGLEGLATSFTDALAQGGFEMVGAAIPAYIRSIGEFWEHERAAEPDTPTSPHVLARRARLLTVQVPSVTVRAPGRVLNDDLVSTVVARVRGAVAQAYRNGEARLPAAVGAA